MADLIERDAVIWITAETGALETQRRVKELPAVNRWIPCSERLPEENKVVLVSTTTGYVDFAVLRWGKWFPDGYNGVAFPSNRITAWMPKPDAYEPPKEDET